MGKEDTLTLMTKGRIHRSLKRMAHEINEQNTSNHPVLLFGINHRGFSVANLLAEMLSEIIGGDVLVKQLMLDKGKDVSEKGVPANSRDYFIVIVDDVIFSGKTMFRALKSIDDLLNLREVHTAVLVDRGHRKYPVKAEFYGMELPTKLNEHVTVTTENKQIQKVQLIHQ